MQELGGTYCILGYWHTVQVASKIFHNADGDFCSQFIWILVNITVIVGKWLQISRSLSACTDRILSCSWLPTLSLLLSLPIKKIFIDQASSAIGGFHTLNIGLSGLYYYIDEWSNGFIIRAYVLMEGCLYSKIWTDASTRAWPLKKWRVIRGAHSGFRKVQQR